MGFLGGAQPILSYNFGANLIDRTNKIAKRGYCFTVGFAFIYMLIFYLFPTQIAKPFTHDPNLIEITKNTIYLMMYALPFADYNIFTATYFQSYSSYPQAVFITGSRVLLFMIPLAAILPNVLGVNSIYLIIPLFPK